MKIKQSILSKIITLLLSVIMILNIIPTFTLPAQAAGSDNGFIIPVADMPAAQTNGFIAPIEKITDTTGWTAISTRAGLAAIANNLSGKYYLTADIDLSGTEWSPIGNNATTADRFSGTFDGQGYVIKNLKITSSISYSTSLGVVGLFGATNGATIKNVGLVSTNIQVSSTYYSFTGGGICGVSYNGGSISNCYNTGAVTVKSRYTAYAGGICGYSTGGVRVSNCYNTGDVVADPASNLSAAAYYAGGICGYISGSGSISNCYNWGDISSDYKYDSSCASYAGGICGYSGSSPISNCYNWGDVSTVSYSKRTSSSSGYPDSTYAGGICGYSTVTINNCYSTGKVSADSQFFRSYAGGVCGYITSGSINNCYSTGNVSASYTFTYSSSVPIYSPYAYAGGICGYLVNSGSITNCYNTGNVSVAADGSANHSFKPYAGGIGGEINGTISNCYNTGKISATTAPYLIFPYIGGICGYCPIISNCYNTGDVLNGVGSAGGIYGLSPSTISNCYNTGNVDAELFVGGIGSSFYSGSISACYWNSKSAQISRGSAQSPKKGIGSGTDTTTPLTSEQMKEQASFVGFDFNTVWVLKSGINNGYPVLQVFQKEPVTHKVSFNVTGGNGVLTAMVDSVGISSGASVEEDESVVFTANPNSGYRVKGWTLNGNVVNGTNTTYTLSSLTAAATVTVTFEEIPPTNLKAITSFTLAGTIGTINESAGTIAVTVPFGTDITNLTPTIVHTGASISPEAAQDFTSPVTYTVTAVDNSQKNYTVTVTIASITDKVITSFILAGATGTINESAGTIAVTVPYGTDIKSLTPTIAYTGAGIIPTIGTSQNFTNPVTYTVIAADFSTKPYVVTVTVASPPTYTIKVNDGSANPIAAAAGTTVTITAGTAPSGKVFDKWTTSDGVTFANANAATTTFTMPAKAVTVTANYRDKSAPPSVTSVTVSPKTASVEKGKTQQFTANVSVTNGAAKTVTWGVSGSSSKNTKISSSGILTVAANETAKTLTVTAKSTADKTKTDKATVTVTSPLKIKTQPKGRTVTPKKTVTLNTGTTGGAGKLKYQWYSSKKSKSGFKKVSGAAAKKANYKAPTKTKGTRYYYCVVTDTNKKTVQTKTVKVTVK